MKGGARGEPDDDEASLDDISLTLIKALPRLFIKHQTDPSRISMVIVIPQLMNLGMYLEMRMMAAYETLWDDVSKQFMTQSSPDVIRHTVGTIKHLLGTTSLQNANQKKIADLEEELASALRDKVGGRTRPKTGGKRALETTILHGDEIAALNVLLYRVESLFNIRNLVSWAEDDDGGKEVRLLDIFTSLMERSKLGNSSEDKVRSFIAFRQHFSSIYTDDRGRYQGFMHLCAVEDKERSSRFFAIWCRETRPPPGIEAAKRLDHGSADRLCSG